MRIGSTLAWACYLGSSWTWVIGMLLPVLLLHDLGPGGWVVFAAPNVLGAAAFAFVLNRQRSAVLTVRHAVACLGFSRVTMAYQVMVLPWALVELWGWSVKAAILGVVIGYLLVGAFTLARPLSGAVVVSLLSLAAFAWFAFQREAWVGVFQEPMLEPTLHHHAAMAFIPAAAFGFLLCPYLDLTFHHARQQAPHPRAAFVLGFGGVFLAMIVFSLAYAGLGAIALIDGVCPIDQPIVRAVLGGHLILQSALTVILHMQRVREAEQIPLTRIALPLPLFLLIGLLMVTRYPDVLQGFDMNVSQMVYRVLLMLYGTLFPAYVLLIVIPTRRRVQAKPLLRTYLFAVGMSLPMAFIVFVEGRTTYVLGLVVIFVLARLIVETLPREVSAGTTEKLIHRDEG